MRRTFSGPRTISPANRLTLHVLQGTQEIRGITIPEKIYLLAHNNYGFVKSSFSHYEEVLKWAVLLELILYQRIKTYELLKRNDSECSPTRFGLLVASMEQTKDEAADELLRQIIHIQQSTDKKRIESILSLVSMTDVVKKVTSGLCAKGIIHPRMFGFYTATDTFVKDNARSDMCELLTCVEDRFHDTSKSSFANIRGLTPALFALTSLLYCHHNVLFDEVIQKHFSKRPDAASLLKNSANDLMVINKYCEDMQGDVFADIKNVLSEHGVRPRFSM